jgi:rod shape-determining protein MreD
MKRFLVILCLGLLSVTTQGVLTRIGLPSFLVPQVSLLIVVFLAFSDVSLSGCVLAFLLGLLMDLSSAVLVGPWAGAYVAVYGVLAALSHRLFIESALASMFITFVSVIGASIIFFMLGTEYSHASMGLALQVLGQAVMTAGLAPWALSLMTRRARRRSPVGVGRGAALSAV